MDRLPCVARPEAVDDPDFLAVPARQRWRRCGTASRKGRLRLANVGLGQILVLAHESNSVNPEFLVPVLLESVADDFGFTDVGSLLSRVLVNTDQNVNAGDLPSSSRASKVVKLGARPSEGFGRRLLEGKV